MSGQPIVYQTLEKMGINYRKTEHRAIFSRDDVTPEEEYLWEGYKVSKNLFLRNAKGDRHYLVVTTVDKKADLKELARKIGSTRLSFSSQQRLERYLKVKPGSVSSFAVLNDESREVIVVFDKDLVGEKHFALHPNENTATVYMDFADVERIVREHGNEVIYAEI
ncbi:MAG TPA: prolyl-tRNA synthetase associated domain-containing protein [Ruminococcaceae bacterium]|nr:prolyl-tRNA synthetase associated domain-containing protein [Oscillospiraceae bacterium]